MKDLIVLFATIMLGIAIAALVLGLGDTAEKLNKKANDSILEEFDIDSSRLVECYQVQV